MERKNLSLTLTCFYFLLGRNLGAKVSRSDGDAGAVGPRILEGTIAEPEEFPFLLRLEGSFGRVCGATVIDNHFVLTAAHCVWDIQCDGIRLYPSTWKPGQVSDIHVGQCYIHEKYAAPALAYDIAILETLENLVEDRNLRTVFLPGPDEVFMTGRKAWIPGWGKTEDGTWPKRLMVGQVHIEDWRVCNWKFREVDPKCKTPVNCPVKNIPRRVVCTHSGGMAAPSVCFGDSGGPLFIDLTVAGIISSTIVEEGVCEIGSPTVHTSVADYLPWIYNITDPTRDTSWIVVPDEPDEPDEPDV